MMPTNILQLDMKTLEMPSKVGKFVNFCTNQEIIYEETKKGLGENCSTDFQTFKPIFTEKGLMKQ